MNSRSKPQFSLKNIKVFFNIILTPNNLWTDYSTIAFKQAFVLFWSLCLIY